MNDGAVPGKSGVITVPGVGNGEDALCEVRCVHPEHVLIGRALLLPDIDYAKLAGIFAALADPTRAKIVYSILHQELCTCDLAAITGISESAVSQHLSVLRRLRLVRSRRAGKVVYYALDDPHINDLLQVCLEHIRDDQNSANDDKQEVTITSKK